ncbi:CDP-glycerol glycerophosphotransferase family protein [Candidatus Parcubacteria bacterium]|nr:CDP-glycerol glycerophosphotransferase family protein [Candidatus Parcubacteria bacterium]
MSEISKKKILFLTLSNRAVFRNLFFFPNCVFSELKKFAETHHDFFIVLLVPVKDVEKYTEAVLGAGLGQHYAVEGVHVPLSKGVVQKVFYFLYSYLIYTHTTKILATIAIRPDEPPAGGRRMLAPIKWLIAHTLGRSNSIKQVLVPKLFLRIFKNNRPFKDLFLKYQPHLVFASHLYGWFDHHMLAESKRRTIPSLGMAAGWDHLDKYFLPFHVDTLLAQSEEIKNSAIKYQGYKAEDIKIVGYPHFDFIVSKENEMPRNAVLEYLKFSNAARYIVYVSGSAYCPDEPVIIAEMLRWMDEGKFGADVYLVIRPYVGGRTKDREFDYQKFNKFSEHPRVVFFSDELWGNVEKSKIFVNVIRYCDILLGMYTTLVLEAAALDRPLLAAAFDGYRTLPFHRSIRRFEQFEHFKDVLKTGALTTAYNFPDLEKYIERYMKDQTLYAQNREVLRINLCHRLDGKSSERVSKEITSLFS